MNRSFRIGLAAAFTAFAALAQFSPAAHAAYPDRPIRWVVPTAAGTPIDAVTRVIATAMGKNLGQPVVVDNKGGAAGSIGGQDASRSSPDGYTLMTVFMPMTVAPALIAKVPFDLRKDFEPVGQMVWSYNALVVHPGLKADSVAGLVAQLRAQPGKLTFGSGGIGTPAHMIGELFKIKTGTHALHVPYNQPGQAMTDMMTGQVQFGFIAVTNVAPFIQSGQLRALAVTSPQRLAALPSVPTMAEAGYADLAVSDWQGLMAPAGTPQLVIDRLNTSLQDALFDPKVREALAKLGAAAAGGAPARLGQLVDSELTRWAEVVKAQNIKGE